jgi:hypothetical protein
MAPRAREVRDVCCARGGTLPKKKTNARGWASIPTPHQDIATTLVGTSGTKTGARGSSRALDQPAGGGGIF